jgi:YrbI family 3-deoxy-D-manno-octulosonate 8-phosphate phosphatase
MLLKQNIEYLIEAKEVALSEFLTKNEVNSVEEFTLEQLGEIGKHYEVNLKDLLFSDLRALSTQLKNIKLLILDVDGVMTDGGMYFTEAGDQMKKYNTKDGMAIIHLTKNDFQVGIISSGFKAEMVKARATLLGIQHFYVGRGKKIEVLNKWCEELGISLSEVAMIGDDINDLEVMQSIGVSACPTDAVAKIKNQAKIILNKKGGEGCVREFIDNYLLPEPV